LEYFRVSSNRGSKFLFGRASEPDKWFPLILEALQPSNRKGRALRPAFLFVEAQ
jgi:hypothetical protein